MTPRNPKLELTWIGKENRPHLEPRILLEDPERSYHASHRVTDKDIFDNRLALKAPADVTLAGESYRFRQRARQEQA